MVRLQRAGREARSPPDSALHRTAKKLSRPRAQPNRGRGSHRLVVGVDTGGTFTDIVFRDGSRHGTFKLLSTPDDPARAVIAALGRLFGDRPADVLTYGTTVATNAMLQRRGSRAALVTTSGFEDVLEIGRQARPALYELEPGREPPLIARRLRLGIEERAHFDGSVARRPTRAALEKLRAKLAAEGVESIAVCLLHAHVSADNERAIAEALAPLDVPITLSHELSAEAGEFERSSTVAANAYVRPLVARHVGTLVAASRVATFRVLQSNGGAIGHATACREPVRTMLSGPAGGVAAAAARAAAIGLQRIITLDMGGTSTDVSLVDGELPRRTITEIGGLPIRTPCIDIHTVGAGGGSVAFVDAGGSLKVGPESAGADPGPACYGKGTLPTVTDANLVLGRLRSEAFLGGNMTLDTARARRALVSLARQTGMADAEQAAEGVVRVVEGNMERAIRVITVERGQDPRDCTLVAFGGAAGLHACGLAAGLGVARILVPRDPGLLSAWGVLDGPVLRDVSATHRAVDPAYDALERAARPLLDAAIGELRSEGVAASRIRTGVFVRLRYLGQSIELEIALSRRFRALFDAEHQRLLHGSAPDRPVEVTSLRASAYSRPRQRPGRAAKPTRRRRPVGHLVGQTFAGGRMHDTKLYDRDLLEPGTGIRGPAVVTEYSSTVLVAEGWRALVDGERNLVMERTRARWP